MADDFDLLNELGDSKRMETLKAKIEKKKQSDVISKLDDIESQIEQAAADNRSAEDIVKNIIGTNFEQLNGDVENTEQDLQELMLHLRTMLDSCGGEFAKLQELNDEELQLIEKAKKELGISEDELKDAEGMSNAWNILFGYKNNKVKAQKEKLDQATANVKSAEEEANRRYRERLKNADIKESLDRIISQVSGMVQVIEEMIVEVDKQIDALKNRKELSFQTKEKAATVMKERKQELDDIEARLKQAEIELDEMQNSTPEHTEQQKKIADLREQRAEIKGKYNIALGIFQSKERFVDQIVVHLEAQTTTKNNLKQLIGQLKSDTEERIATYDSGLQLIQSATAQEAASIYEEAGVKTDQKLTEIAAKVFVSSEKDRIERVKKHPQRLSELHQVLVAMAQATQKYKEQDAELMKQHQEKYGIDRTQEYMWKHEGGGDGDSAGNGEPAGEPEGKKDGGTDSLLD